MSEEISREEIAALLARGSEGMMAKMIFDEEGLLEEPCLSCDKAYIEDIWHEWCCEEKECPYEAERKNKYGNIR